MKAAAFFLVGPPLVVSLEVGLDSSHTENGGFCSPWKVLARALCPSTRRVQKQCSIALLNIEDLQFPKVGPSECMGHLPLHLSGKESEVQRGKVIN